MAETVGPQAVRPLPGTYRVVPERSSVRMSVSGLTGAISAELPVRSGVFVVDDERRVVAARTVLDAEQLTASGVVMRTLKGPSGLDVARFATVEFVSSSVVSDGMRLEVDGMLTMRGVSHPARFEGSIIRSARRRFTVQLEGRIDRMQYGVTVGRPVYGKQATVRIRAAAMREEP